MTGRLSRGRESSPAGRPRHSTSAYLAGAVAVGVVIGVLVWLVVTVVFTLLHIFELLAAAVVAGWLGYRIGYFRGSRQRSRNIP